MSKKDPEEEVELAVEVDSESPATEYPPSIFTDKKGNLKFVNLVVRFPITILIVILFICLFLSFSIVKIASQRRNPFTSPEVGSYDINDIRSTALDSLREAVKAIKNPKASTGTSQLNDTEETLQFQSNTEEVTYWLFETEQEEGLFGSRESIELMRGSFDYFISDKDFEIYCKKDYDNDEVNGTCARSFSPLNAYYPSSFDKELVQSVIDTISNPVNVARYNAVSLCVEFNILCDSIPPLFNTALNIEWAQAFNENMTKITDTWTMEGELVDDIDLVTELAAKLLSIATKGGLVSFGYDKDFSADNLKSAFSRSFISWGSPLDRSKINPEPYLDPLEYKRFKNSREGETDYLDDRLLISRYVAFTFLDRMDEVSNPKYSSVINSYYFMPSLIGEVLLKIISLDGMLANFSFAFIFLYVRFMVGSWFLASIGMMQIFLSLPIAWFIYDQVFQIQYFSVLNVLCIFIVAAIGADDIFIFMDAYKQSAYQDASVLESLQSRMSWVYRRTGSAMAITSATTCSAFLCTLLTPLASVSAFGIFAALVIFVDYVLVMSLYCTAVVIYHNKFEKEACCCAPTCCMGGICKTSDPNPTEKALEKQDHNEDKVIVFFRSKVSPFLMKRMNRIILGVFFCIWLIIAAVQGSRIKPTQESEEFLNENHPLQKSVTILSNKFPTTQNDVQSSIYFAWGVGEIDRSGVNQLRNPEFIGEATFIEDFTFDEVCQTEIVNLCENLKISDDYAANIKQEDGLGIVHCFVEEFAAYSAYGNLDDCEAVKNGAWKNETWQVSAETAKTMMPEFLSLPSCYSPTSRNMTIYYANQIGWDGQTLKFAAIAPESDVVGPFTTDPETVVRNEYDTFIGLTEELDKTFVQSCGSKTLMTDLDFNFVFMNTQRIYVRSALQSSLLGLLIAFVVLMIATRVFHIALFASINILCVLTSVLGSMVMLGWDLGSIEGILITIIAGFSVDYVVHLAHAYERATGDTQTRIAKAFGEMGISVLSGMVTSVGASIPLFMCQLVFFKKFGTFICLTIAFSWVFANFFFMAILIWFNIPIDNSKKCCKF